MCLKVCFFGTYEKNYPRNYIFIKSLKECGVDVIEINFEVKENEFQRYTKIINLFFLSIRFILAYIVLFLKSLKIKQVDAIIFGYPSPLDVIFFAPVFKLRKFKVFFNPLVSIYDTFIIDRKFFSHNSIIAKVLYHIDRLAYKISDKIFIDTKTHANYLSELFKLEINKFSVIPLGSMEEFLKEIEPEKYDKFTVLYVGKYIPLHSTETIIEASYLLKDKNINFIMIGKGQEYEKIINLAQEKGIDNVKFIEWMDRNELINEMKRVHVVLGIFKKEGKASRVIPNKVYDALAGECVIITGRTPAILEFFKENEEIFLVEPENPLELAEKILWIKSNYDMAKLVAKRGKKKFLEISNYKKIGNDIIKVLREQR